MPKTTVKKHPRKTKSGRTNVKRHQRRKPNRSKIVKQQMDKSHADPNKSKLKHKFANRIITFPKKPYKTIENIEDIYLKAGYEKALSGIETNSHGSDSEWLFSLKNGSREHHRIFNDRGGFWLESHIDSKDPKYDPMGHYIDDVLAPDKDISMRLKNFNDTQWIYLKS